MIIAAGRYFVEQTNFEVDYKRFNYFLLLLHAYYIGSCVNNTKHIHRYYGIRLW